MKFIKSNIREVVFVSMAILLIIVCYLLLVYDSKHSEKVNPIDESERLEDQIKEITGMSKEDAIELVKPNLESENYVFASEITNDSLYKVTATNTINDEKTIYYVDPTNSKVYIDIDAK